MYPFLLGKKILLGLLPILVLCVLLEGTLRVVSWHRDVGTTIAAPVIPDKDLIWKLAPQQSGPYKTNEYGLRDTPLNLRAARKILLLGDSVSWGDGVKEIERIYPYVLEQLLSRRDGKTYEVINSSVLGYSTFQQYRYLELNGLQFEPDMIVLQFCLNDVVERYDSLFEYGGDNIFMGVDTRSAIQGVYGWLLRNSRAYEAGVRWLKTLSRKKQAYRVEAMTVDMPSQEIQEAWRLTLVEIENIRKFSDKAGIPFLLVVFPYAFQLDDPAKFNQPQLLLKRYASEKAVRIVDLLPDFAEFQAKSQSVTLFYDQNHLTIEGHQLAAELLSDRLFAAEK